MYQNQDAAERELGLGADPMMSAVQRSLIAETIHGARVTLNEPSRPFTPGDLPRHLFQGDDYSNRPGSSYKINNAVTQAADEFQKSHTSSFKSTAGGESNTTLSSTAKKQNTTEDVISLMNRTNASMNKRGGFGKLPVVGKGLPVKPVKPIGKVEVN